MADGERHLTIAAAAGTMGRFQLEAAIQSVHAQRAFSGNIDWGSVVLLYDALVCLSPTVGALVARAATLGQAIDAIASLGALDELPERIVVDYQPFWAVARGRARTAGPLRGGRQRLRAGHRAQQRPPRA
jgi:RNA polymerase sigma-70 factor (ECF subfamily)